MNKIAKNHLLFRFILLFNIVFITITIILAIIVNNTISGISIPPYIRATLNKMNLLIFIFSFIIILLNAYLLINHLFYNTKQYFKLAEKVDFNDLETSIGIINNLPTIDEFGDIGKNVTKLLRVYLNYANLMRKRIAYKDKKLKVLVEQAKIPLLSFERSSDTKEYILSYVSPAAKSLLEVENTSFIIGKSVSSLFSKETTAYLQNIASQNPRETPPTQMTLLGTVEWMKISSEKDPKDSSFDVFDVAIVPFAFQFPDDFQYQNPKNNASNFNTIVDSFFLLIHKKLPSSDDSEISEENESHSPEQETSHLSSSS